MKVFISQTMRDKTDEEILETRAKIIDKVKYLFDKENIEVLDSFFQGAPHDANPLWYIGESLKVMSEADLVVFAPGWEKARGCCIERQCCISYNKSTLFVELED